MNIFDRNVYYGWMLHFNAIFYPISQVYQGKTLLVDFLSTYGLSPHFLNWIFKIIGLSVFKYSLVMSFINAAIYAFLAWLLFKIMNNKLIAFLTFASVLFYSYFLTRCIYFNDIYFQYFPLRMLFPTLLLLSCSFYPKYKRNTYIFSLIIFPIGILWNTDFGIVTFISWLLFLIYFEFSSIRNFKLFAIKSIQHIVLNIASLITIFMVFGLYIYFRSSHLPNFFKLLEYQRYFYITGFAMQPLKTLPSLWGIIIIIYFMSLSFSLIKLERKNQSTTDSLIFTLSILGLGIFIYHQGKSDYYTMTMINYPAFILLGIFSNKLVDDFKTQKTNIVKLFIGVLLLFIVSTGIFNSIYKSRILLGWAKAGSSVLISSNPNNIIVSQNITFIKKHTSPHEKTLILSSQYDGLYYAETNTACALNIPGSGELFLKSDYIKIIEAINSAQSKIFIEPNNNDPVFNKALLDKLYTAIDSSENKQMFLISKSNGRKINILEENYLNNFTILNATQMTLINPCIENYFELGNYLNRNELFAESIKAYEKALAYKPYENFNYSQVFCNLGWVNGKTQAWDKAIYYTKKALEIDSSNLIRNNLNWLITEKLKQNK